MFQEFINKTRDIFSPKMKILNNDGENIDTSNVKELRKGELVEFISSLEADKETQKKVLDNLDDLKKSFSKEFHDEVEDIALGKIIDIDNALEKARKGLADLKEKFADAIIYNNKGQILFLRRKNSSSFAPGVLGLPGGHIDPGEDAETAAKRELLEETNLKAINCIPFGEFNDDEKEISYFYMEVEKDGLIILEASEHGNLEWKYLNDLCPKDSIPGLKEKLVEMLDPIKHSIGVIKKGFDEGIVSEEQYLEALSKAAASIGEVREWSGQKMKKEANGWVPVKGDAKGGKEEEEKDPRAKKDDKKKQKKDKGPEEEKEPATPEQLGMHAKNTDSDTLRATAENPNAEPALQQAAQAELSERGEKPSVKQRLKEKAKDWHAKQVEFYQSGALDAGSEDRKGLKGFLAKKKDGIIAAVKDEIHEFKETGSGLKKFFSGNKSEITAHEKKAMKTIAIHLGVVIGGMALTGGLSGLASKGAGALAKGIVAHYFEHAGIMRLGHVLAFAKAEDGEKMSEEEFEKILGELIDNILEHIESGNISEDDWMAMGDSSSGDFDTVHSIDEEGEGEEEEGMEEEGAEGEEKEEGEESEEKEVSKEAPTPEEHEEGAEEDKEGAFDNEGEKEEVSEEDDIEAQMKAHGEHYDEAHMEKMKTYMEAGADFNEAHQAALEEEEEEGSEDKKEDKKEDK